MNRLHFPRLPRIKSLRDKNLNYDYTIYINPTVAPLKNTRRLQMRRFVWERCALSFHKEPLLTTLRLIKEECVLGAASTRRLKLLGGRATAPQLVNTEQQFSGPNPDLPGGIREEKLFRLKKRSVYARCAYCEKGYAPRPRQLMKLQLCRIIGSLAKG
jgi:hypothetical protein